MWCGPYAYGEYGLRWTFDRIIVPRILAQLAWRTSGDLPMYGTSTAKATPTFRTRALHRHRRAVPAGKKQPAAQIRPVRPRACDPGERAAFWPRCATVHDCMQPSQPHSLTQPTQLCSTALRLEAWLIAHTALRETHISCCTLSKQCHVGTGTVLACRTPGQ